MTTETMVRRVATYERVSSEDQRERETIKTQRDALDARLAGETSVTLIDRYVDDGVSGSKNVANRPDGGRLLHDAEAGRFNELWVYRLDRLGRDLVDMAIVGRRLRQLGIRLISVIEGEPDPFMFDIQAAMAENEKRVFRQRSEDGLNRAAGEGRFCGGIVAFGYVVEGRKESARLAPDTDLVSPALGLSAAGVVRRIYERLGIDGWSCPRVAQELNALGVPTTYLRDGRAITKGKRQGRTQGVWRSGRIRNLVREPKYKGIQEFGRRSNSKRKVIVASVEPLVSPELWQAAQDTLARNRTIARNTRRRYALKSVIRCGICGLTYSGTAGRAGVAWYRCNGQLVERGPLAGRCPGQSIRTDRIEPAVWADIEHFLRDPGDVLDDLQAEQDANATGAVAEAEVITLGRALEHLEAQRKQALALSIRGRLPDAELDAELDRINGERSELERRMAALEPSLPDVPPEAAIDLFEEVRRRLDAGLTDDQRHEIVRLLVRIVVHTELPAEGRRKSARAVVEYRFPGVVETNTDRGSSQRRAGSAPERPSPAPPGRSPPGPPRAAGGAPRARHGRTRAARRGTGRPGRPG